MTAHQFFESIQDLSLFTALRESGLPYPIVLSLHLTTLAIFGGLILVSDLRLLGVAFKNIPVSEIISRTRPWKRLGFVLMVTWGVLLGGAKIATYYDNPYFQIKMTLLLLLLPLHAIIFKPRVYDNPTKFDGLPKMPAVAKTAACFSLVIWLGIMSMGRWIAYYDRPEDHPRRPGSHGVASSLTPGQPPSPRSRPEPGLQAMRPLAQLSSRDSGGR
ncbi:MAG TPA: DUF6644 family protein [Bryobacteraceae bacterium]|nr:DUF6644 family protein [Bryobacteraceae bacterium]